ncbi:hypothetical protein EJ05DRAFT_479367 [Pseudovirgaria hyperparasitica]|uniref:Uncharacterized protein n=1 Tax=Pseudovirgaria hyperparasitica TaxID=470096 RepID=A0A6A6VXK5_9PEZI|nr:uncharacterized protein EJ05DRAFT_479367 [Pseudovirgaria hyperparasitica]KAF2754370.1 hypothetical protein EJ05DRAFT_479367 [Pseudovirgaria hyperparasitica]
MDKQDKAHLQHWHFSSAGPHHPTSVSSSQDGMRCAPFFSRITLLRPLPSSFGLHLCVCLMLITAADVVNHPGSGRQSTVFRRLPHCDRALLQHALQISLPGDARPPLKP